MVFFKSNLGPIGLLVILFSTNIGVAPLFWSDPIDGSEPVPGCSFNSFYLLFFFKSVATQIPGLTRMENPNRSSVYSDHFHLSYHNILFTSFNFRVFIYVETF